MEPDILEELQTLFSWNPPKLVPRPLPMSTKTRSPKYFDKHFHKALQLLHVKRLPTLVRDITAIVDATITDGVDFPSGLLFSEDVINTLGRGPGTRMADEKAVASFYGKTTAILCLQAASVLALRVPFMLHWTQSANVSGYAIADGFLQFVDAESSSDMYTTLERMGKETKHIRTLADRVSSLAIFEFKNLAAGGPEVMLAIPRLTTSQTFYWPTCNNAPDCATMSTHETERRKAAEAEAKLGYDARTPPWSFDLPSNNSVSSNVQDCLENVGTGSKRKREDETSDQTREQASYSETLPLIVPQGSGPLRTDKASKQRREDTPRVAHAKTLKDALSMPSPPIPVEAQVEAALLKENGKRKGKGKEKAQDGYGNDDANDPSYQDNHGLSVQHIVQQAWAQATRADCSIIVLQSGNHEFISIRRRRTQTLYISDLIEPHACKEPAYGKLHVGVYMAAVQDAIDRERQRTAGTREGPDGGGPSRDSGSGLSSGGPGSSGPGDGSNGVPTEGGSTGSMMARAAHGMAAKETWEIASRRNVILVYLQYGIYDSPAPSTFVRSGPTGQAPIPLPSWEIVRNYKLDECLTIVLTSEIGHGATGEVLRGTLGVEASACVRLDVAVKLAFASEQRDAIRNEYKMYHLLRERGVTTGITTPLGLFDDVEGEACALVMPYVGIPLSKMPEFVLPFSFQEAVLANLKEIHQADIHHGDLRLDNILVADSGLTIIDFARSRVCYDQDAKNREYSQLQSLLARQNGYH